MKPTPKLKQTIKATLSALNLFYIGPRARYRPMLQSNRYDPFTLALCTVFPDLTGLSFCQIGANDGKTNDYVHDLVTRYNWRGVLFEPIPTTFADLKETYKGNSQCELRNEAVGITDGEESIFYIGADAGLPAWTSQIASFSKDHILSHASSCPEIVANIASMRVKVAGINEILKDCFDVLVIDAEGMDFELLVHANSDRLPRFIGFETSHMADSEWLRLRDKLTESKFEVWSTGLDAVAFRPLC
jgi:FkbM family methyltransferase